MFTLKLYRRKGPPTIRSVRKIIAVHHVIVMGVADKALELWAFMDASSVFYDTYYIGEPGEREHPEAFGRDDLHLNTGSASWWGWGILENWEGNTTEHYRPAGADFV